MVWTYPTWASNSVDEEKFFMQADDPSRKRGRPNGTWMKVERMDMEKCSLTTDLAQRRLEW